MVTSLSVAEAGRRVRGSSEFSLVCVQPALGPLHDTSLLVAYNDYRYYQNALTSHSFFLCHPKGLAGDFIHILCRSQGPLYLLFP